MEQFKDIFIYCASEEDVPSLFEHVRGQVESAPNWAVDEEEMARATSENFYGEKEFLAIDYFESDGQMVGMLVLLHDDAGKVYVSNIIPGQKNRLTEANYNEILAAFDRDILSPAIVKWGGEHKRKETKAHVSIDDVFPESLSGLLKGFAQIFS